MSPATLNSGSQGNWITARIETHGWAATDIVVGSLRLDGVAPAGGSVGATADPNPDGGALSCKFPREPVAARPDGGSALVYGRDVLLAPPGDPAALAAAVASLAADPGLRTRLAAGAAALARQFTWESIASTHLDIYRRLALPGD